MKSSGWPINLYAHQGQSVTTSQKGTRFRYQDNIRFCIMARGSLSETLDHLIITFDEKIINREQLQTLQAEYESCLKLINGDIKYLKGEKYDAIK